MSVHIHEVLDYLDAHPICRHPGGVESLLELLHEAYTMYNTIDSEAIRDKFRELRQTLETLPPSDADALFAVTCDLCVKHEQVAFSHGILVGIHLMTEINALP